MDYTTAHNDREPGVADFFPDNKVPWQDAVSPDIERGIMAGRLRACRYCGSMHPHDVAEAIRGGATGEWADRKYGWPHKSYFTGIPNPHAGMLESRSSANFRPDDGKDWIQVDERHFREPGRPASDTTWGKFYTIHLKDASPEDRNTIEHHLGLSFAFYDDGLVHWTPVRENSDSTE